MGLGLVTMEGRQTDRQMDSQIDKWTERAVDDQRRVVRQIDGHMVKQTDGRWSGRQVGEWQTDRQIRPKDRDRQADGWPQDSR